MTDCKINADRDSIQTLEETVKQQNEQLEKIQELKQQIFINTFENWLRNYKDELVKKSHKEVTTELEKNNKLVLSRPTKDLVLKNK